MTQKMLGKLETVFSYMTHFFLQSWPEKHPGILFLVDSAGTLLQIIPLQIGQSWHPARLPLPDTLTSEGYRLTFPAAQRRSGKFFTAEEQDGSQTTVWAGYEWQEKDGSVRATIGLAVPKSFADFEPLSYIRGIEPLLLMGYDAYIQHATSEIVMNVNRYDRADLVIKSLIEQIAQVIDKGYCSAVKLTSRGTLLPQERLTSEEREKQDTHLIQILPRFIDQEIKPMILDNDRVVVFPVQCEGRPLAALFLHLPPEETECRYDERDVAFLQEVGERASYSILRSMLADDLSRDARKKDMLYQLTKKIQASIDVNDVLEEIMNSIRLFYPYLEAELLLTLETNTSLPVKSLSLSSEAEISNRAYMEGRLIVGEQETNGRRAVVIAAPLLGKQGIYGVLQLTANELVSMSETETEYISILAETAGTAFENAQLYQQSRNSIRELRLINQMAQQLNRSLNLEEILQFVTKMLLETFAAEYCAILSKIPDEETLVVLSSSHTDHIGRTISSHEKPLCEIFRNKQALILAHPDTDTMPFSLTPFSSLMGVPLLREEEVTGILLVSDTRQQVFSFDDYKLLEIFGQHTSLAITNAMLHNEMERMVITDNLTGLHSRRYLNERVRQSIEKDELGSLILIDIDFFKKVNDTYGHQVGDEVLVQVASLIRRNIRETDIAARWGGEELAVYLPRVDVGTAVQVAERIRSCVETETVPAVTISCGLARWERSQAPGVSVETLFHHADVALYEAKNGGRNQVRTA